MKRFNRFLRVIAAVAAVAAGAGLAAAPVYAAGDGRSGDTAPPITGNLSGLGWASGFAHNDQLQSVYEGFGAWRGRPVDVAKVFPLRGSWDEIAGPNSFIYSNFATFRGRLAIAVPLFPSTIDNATGLAECSAGQYDGEWATFGASLVGNGRGNSIVQLGWEFNGSYNHWYASDTEQWIDCFRNATTAIRSEAPQVLIDWTINGHGTPPEACDGSAWNCYPGDAYVDIVGIHDYDHYPRALTAREFNARANGSEGLNTVHNFAARHHKWMSVLEWGVDHNPNKGDNAGGDNPLYIQMEHDWFARHAAGRGGRLVVEAYLDDGCMDWNVASSLTPECGNANSASTYQRVY